MKRRSLLLAPLVAFDLPALAGSALRAAPPPWSARWLQGGFDGTHWWAGLALSLQPHWKTYWRVPGAGGIAPEIMVLGGNLKSFAVHHPLPRRFESEAGETIGYVNEVVFPIALVPADPSLPLTARFSAFIGVCDVVCIPAQSAGDIGFDPATSAAPDQQDISRWMRMVPKTTDKGPISAVTAMAEGADIRLKMETRSAIADLFIEADAKYYFAAPTIMRGLALVNVKGAQQAEELKSLALRITLDSGDGPLEQSVKVG